MIMFESENHKKNSKKLDLDPFHFITIEEHFEQWVIDVVDEICSHSFGRHINHDCNGLLHTID